MQSRRQQVWHRCTEPVINRLLPSTQNVPPLLHAHLEFHRAQFWGPCCSWCMCHLLIVWSTDTVQYHQYADNLLLYLLLVLNSYNVSRLYNCTLDVSQWFLQNAPLLNPTKTEADIFGTQQQLPQINSSSGVDVVGTNVWFAASVKVLCMTLDASLPFNIL